MVIDDGSSDNTGKISKDHGAMVFTNIQSKGLAYSFQFAIDKILELNADIAVNIDGDLQFLPEEIPLLVKPIQNDNADFVAANRFIDPGSGKSRKPLSMPFLKYIGNKIGAYVVGKLSYMKFADVTCGFRAYSREALLSLNINNKFTYTQEAFQILASKKLNILQVPVSVQYFKERKSRVVSSISSYIFTSGVNIVRAFKDFAPLRFFGTLSIAPTLIGLACLIFISIYWLKNGEFSPYKFVGFAGLYLVSFGILIMIFGVLSDILGRILNNQEKILYYTKKTYYSKKKEK
jgi:glycosyltransferase involved in cell wall biosynthesis